MNESDLSQYSDTYAKELEKLIESKVKGRMVVADAKSQKGRDQRPGRSLKG